MKNLKLLWLSVILNSLMGAVAAHVMRTQLDANRTQIKELHDLYYQKMVLEGTDLMKLCPENLIATDSLGHKFVCVHPK